MDASAQADAWGFFGMANAPRDREIEKASASADAFPAVPQGQPLSGESSPDDDDNIAAVLQGNRAVTGKAVWSANYAGRVADDGEHARKEQDAKAEDRAMRELVHLAEWNAQMTVVGGVEMTNEEAQAARQHIIDHDEEYAERAVRRGHIRADEKGEYKYAIRRIHELEEKRGRGTITREEEQECDRWKKSRAGREAEQNAGEFHDDARALTRKSEAGAYEIRAAIRPAGSAVPDKSVFQSAPELGDSFARARATTAPLDTKPIPPSPKVAVTGLDV